MRLIADLGLSLLLALIVETMTGSILFLFAHGLTPKGSAWSAYVFNALASSNLLVIQDISFQTDLHVWAGYLSTGAIVLKAWASWPTLTGWWPHRLSPARLTFEKTAAWALLILGPASYLTGLALVWRPFLRYDPTIRNAHLWVSLALVVALGRHVWRFFPTGLKVFWVQLRGHAAVKSPVAR